MTLISVANLQALADHYSAIFEMARLNLGLAANVEAPPAGTSQYLADLAVAGVMGLPHPEQVLDLLTSANFVLDQMDAEQFGSNVLLNAINGLNAHCAI